MFIPSTKPLLLMSAGRFFSLSCGFYPFHILHKPSSQLLQRTLILSFFGLLKFTVFVLLKVILA